jgi:hypothetical protein
MSEHEIFNLIIVAHKYFMLTPTDYIVDPILFQEACIQSANESMKTVINQPTGSFFYDPWVLKDEYKGTVWETLYNSLPVDKGEARIIVLKSKECYQIHADIDDRYHLNLKGESCYLIDLICEQMYPLNQDGVWYNMDASILHTATNFGRHPRIQLVVRHLLKQSKLIDPVAVSLSTTVANTESARFLFDSHISPWLNEANKLGFINNFDHSPIAINFNIERSKLDCLKNMLPEEFKLI